MFMAKSFWKEPLTIYLWIDVIIIIVALIFSILNLVDSINEWNDNRGVLTTLNNLQRVTNNLQTSYGGGNGNNGYFDRFGTTSLSPSVSYGYSSPYWPSSNYGQSPLAASMSQPAAAAASMLNSTTVAQAQEEVKATISLDRTFLILNAFLCVAFVFRIVLTPWYMISGGLFARKVRKVQAGNTQHVQEYTPMGIVQRNVSFRLAYVVQLCLYAALVVAFGVSMLVLNASEFSIVLLAFWAVTIAASIVALALASVHLRSAIDQRKAVQPLVGQHGKLGSSTSLQSIQQNMIEKTQEENMQVQQQEEQRRLHLQRQQTPPSFSLSHGDHVYHYNKTSDVQRSFSVSHDQHEHDEQRPSMEFRQVYL